MAPLSKSGSRLHRDVGSNPTLSAIGSSQDPSSAGVPERCWSGRTGATGNRVGEQSPHGFKSHPLRQSSLSHTIQSVLITSRSRLLEAGVSLSACSNSVLPRPLRFGRISASKREILWDNKRYREFNRQASSQSQDPRSVPRRGYTLLGGMADGE